MCVLIPGEPDGISRPTSFAATHLAATASFNNIYDKSAAAFNIVRGNRHQIHLQVGA